MSVSDNSVIPGWYPDPSGAVGQERFWNGAAWTETVRLAPIASGLSSDSEPLAALITRPLVVEQILDAAVNLMKRHPKSFIGFPMLAITGLVVLVLVSVSIVGAAAFGNATTGAGGLVAAMIMGYLVFACAFYVAFTIVETVVISGAQQTLERGEATWASALGSLRRCLPRALGVTLVCAVIPLVPVLLTFLIVIGTQNLVLLVLVPVAWCAGVWLATRYSLALPALLVEELTVSRALSRSAELVQGSWWRVWGTQLVPTALMAILAVAGFVGLFGLVSILTLGVTWPFYALVLLLQYHDLRVRRGAGATKLQAAPGTPESL